VKNEVSKLETLEHENVSELSAIVRNSEVGSEKIIISTENASVARRIFNLIKSIYGISAQIIVRKGYNYSKKYIYMLEIRQKINQIVSSLSIKNVPDDFIVDDDELKMAYLRGLFLICGSVNDPKKSRYHLEFTVDNYDYAIFVSQILNHFYLNSKILKRDSKYMVYVKEAEKIGDFLRIIRASSAVLYFEDIRIYRDHKNMTNRLNNCEQANIDKIIMTANEQVKDIELIEKIGGLELLDEKERIVAYYRLKYKDASLLELSEIISYETGKKITKSGIYHRFKKIKELADRIRAKENIK